MTTEMTLDYSSVKPASGAKTLWPWYSVEMLGSYSSTLINAGVFWYAADVLNAGDSARLWLAATYGYAYIVISLVGGKLVERFGPRRVGIAAIGSCVISALVGLLATKLLGLVGLGIAMLLFNLTTTPYWPAAETAVTHAPGSWSLSTRTGMYNILWSTTNFLGYFTVGKIFQQGRFLNFFLAAGISVVGVGILTIFTKPATSADAHHPTEEPEVPADPTVARRAARLLLMAWIGNALAYVAIQTLMPSIPTLTRNLHLPSPAMGAAASSVWAFTRTLFFVLILRWTSWHYSVRYLLGFQVLLVASFFLAMRVDHLGLPTGAVLPMFLFLQIGFGAACAFVYTSSLYYAMHVSRGAGGHAGLHEALIGMGFALGPTIGAIAGTGNSHDTLSRVAYAVTGLLVLGILAMLMLGITAPRISKSAI